MDSNVSTADVSKIKDELTQIRAELKAMHSTIDVINRALVGDLGGYTGLLTRMGMVEHRVDKLDEANARLDAIEEWRQALKNRAIGISIGLAMGSAGIGALVSTVVNALMGS